MKFYKEFKKNYPILSFVALFLSVSLIMFTFFFIQMVRPMSLLKDRMNNEAIDWEGIKKRVVKLEYGDPEAKVLKTMGEADYTFTSGNRKVLSYQRYGLYEARNFYEVELRADTLYEVIHR